MEEGEDLKGSASQRSGRMRGEVSVNTELCQQTSLLPELQRLSAPQITTADLRSDV